MNKAVVLIGLFLIAGWVESAVVIHDTGTALSIAPYHSGQPTKENDSPTPASASAARMTQLPIRTSNLSPGTVAATHHDIPHLQIPLFLIGSDAKSQAWLVKHRNELKRLNAVGLLVSVETDRELREMRALAGDLWLIPASGHDIAKELGLQHYPVLITKRGLEQ